MRQIETAREVIEALGGIKAVAALTGRKTGTVSAWQVRFESFPPELYVLMTDALAKIGAAAPNYLWRQVDGVSLEVEDNDETVTTAPADTWQAPAPAFDETEY